MAQEIYHRSEWGNPTETWGNVYLNADLTNELYKRASEYENSWVTDQLLNGVGIKPSIILTPTAYEDGVLNSVKPAKTLGSELVTNGDGSSTIGWDLAYARTTLSINNNKLRATATEVGAYGLSQDLSLNTSKKYIITANINVDNASGGTANLRIATNVQLSTGATTLSTTTGTTTTTFTPTASTMYIGIVDTADSSSNYVEIISISVKEVTEADFDFTRGSSATRVNEQGLVEDVQILSGELVQNGDFEQIGSELVTNGDFSDGTNDWTFGTDITIENEKAFFNDSAYPQAIEQTNVVTIGKQYKVSFTVSDYQSGTVKLRHPFEVSGVQSDGDYVFYGEAASTGITLRGDGIPNNFKIDNVSVKEVGQNWTFFGEAEFTDNGVRIYSSSGGQSYINQPILTNTKKYRLSYEITDSTTGSLKLINVNGLSDYPIPSTVGTHTLDFIANNNTFFIYRNSGATDVTIDNISVVEVTDDTDLPRINYTDGEGSLLLEPQSTNLVTYSEDFSQYSTVSVTLESGYLAPDGSNTAYKVTGTVGTSSIYLSSVVSGTDTRTIWARTVSGTGQAHLCSYFGNTNNTFTITPQWQRFEVNGTTTSTGAGNFYAIDFRGDTDLSELIIWGSQAEALSYATSYIPTNGSTVTRLADVCNNSGNSDLINSTEGVLYAEISALADDGTNRLLSLNDGTASNAIWLYFNASNNVTYIVRVGGVTQAISTYTIDIKSFNKIAIKYKENDFALWINGTEVSTGTSGSTYPSGTLNNISFDAGDGALDFYGNVKCVAVFKEALSDTELEKLTTI